MNPPALEIDHLAKRYGKLPVLESLTLTVTRGECFGLVGMNGAGKTTLIKCLLDFCDIDGGEIRIFGVPHRETHARKPLAYLPESFLPPHSLTGRDFVKYMLALREQSYDEAAARAMCAALDLDAQALDRQARSYSKGMTQKLGLAAGFLSQAELFILDERPRSQSACAVEAPIRLTQAIRQDPIFQLTRTGRRGRNMRPHGDLACGAVALYRHASGVPGKASS